MSQPLSQRWRLRQRAEARQRWLHAVLAVTSDDARASIEAEPTVQIIGATRKVAAT